MPDPTHLASSQAGAGPTPAAPDGPPSQDLSISTRADGERIVVTVHGELDIATQEQLHTALRSALARSVRGIDLDLAGVAFCDCSGLTVLLRIHRQALKQSKTATIRSTSPAAHRLLDLTRTLPLLAGPEGSSLRHANGVSRHDAGTSGDGNDKNAQAELAQLRSAMETRPTIDLARGILMATFHLSADEAWDALVMASQNTNIKLRCLARQVVDAVHGEPLPEALRTQLSDAVTKLGASCGRPSPSPPP
jgi:anti-anti-sigma factor